MLFGRHFLRFDALDQQASFRIPRDDGRSRDAALECRLARA